MKTRRAVHYYITSIGYKIHFQNLISDFSIQEMFYSRSYLVCNGIHTVKYDDMIQI